ncbi:MAG: hypothetical protein ACYCOU_22735 [Sulfobacillus sp.]
MSKYRKTFRPDSEHIDAESKLRRLGKRLTKDPNKQSTAPAPVPAPAPPYGNYLPVPDGLSSQWTRSDYPAADLRSAGVNRLQPLFYDPQAENTWMPPTEVNLPTRLISKDSHIPCVPVPMM